MRGGPGTGCGDAEDGAEHPSPKSIVSHPLKAMLGWYEGADDRCRDEIFGDIFMLAFGSSAARGLVDFQAYDAEQAFLPGVEHTRP